MRLQRLRREIEDSLRAKMTHAHGSDNSTTGGANAALDTTKSELAKIPAKTLLSQPQQSMAALILDTPGPRLTEWSTVQQEVTNMSGPQLTKALAKVNIVAKKSTEDRRLALQKYIAKEVMQAIQ